MMRESITAAISSSVAENAVCSCEGRSQRRALLNENLGGTGVVAILQDCTQCAVEVFRLSLSKQLQRRATILIYVRALYGKSSPHDLLRPLRGQPVRIAVHRNRTSAAWAHTRRQGPNICLAHAGRRSEHSLGN